MSDREPVIHVILPVIFEALAQDNGDGTWTVKVPALSTHQVTASRLNLALEMMAHALSATMPEDAE